MLSQAIKVVIISALLSSIVSLGINFSGLENAQASSWYVSIAFHIMISFLLNFVLFKKKSAPEDFIFKLMATSMGRLLFCMIGVFIYSMVDKPHFFSFAIHFMLHYILFTILEINYLLKVIKTEKT